MSLFDLRVFIESHLPWWVVLTPLLPFAAYGVWFTYMWYRR